MATDIDPESNNQGLQEFQRIYARDALRVIVARAEAVEFAGLTKDVAAEVQLPWDRGEQVVAVDIERVVVERSGGAATSVDIEIRTKAGGTGLDIAYQFLGGSVPVFDKVLSPKVPFLSEETAFADRIQTHVALTPRGSGGDFKVRIYARPRR